MGIDVERLVALTEELYKAVPHGFTSKLLLKSPIIKALAQVEDGLEQRAAEMRIRNYLRIAVDEINESTRVDFLPDPISPERMQQALTLLLFLNKGKVPVDSRRADVMELMGAHFAFSTWRARFGREWQLLEVLAERLLLAEEDHQTSSR
ncbi:hypothetical protein [Actinomadura decatromicini]|uniref:Uncharacterized protein n=1 Tax=Actinomadura decatromicini TaxID=2604572 RepID=A0A5D3F8C1_9ACTN|nr:hypothetical protein [Actinomadura decatromicini]TYK44571.1 hypothetical protein FXF68_34500 [Actinomadura decatromicini]